MPRTTSVGERHRLLRFDRTLYAGHLSAYASADAYSGPLPAGWWDPESRGVTFAHPGVLAAPLMDQHRWGDIDWNAVRDETRRRHGIPLADPAMGRPLAPVPIAVKWVDDLGVEQFMDFETDDPRLPSERASALCAAYHPDDAMPGCTPYPGSAGDALRLGGALIPCLVGALGLHGAVTSYAPPLLDVIGVAMLACAIALIPGAIERGICGPAWATKGPDLLIRSQTPPR